MSEETVLTVTPQLVWQLQVCDNELGAYEVFSTHTDENKARTAFDSFKVRLVQKSLIELGQKG